MALAKVQHYVPQFLLKNFGNGKKNQLWVFDKFSGKSFLTNAKNVASESRFYDFEMWGEAVSLEPILTKVEAAAKPLIRKLLDADSVETLNEQDRTQLAVFMSIQLARTRSMREQWCDFPRLIHENLQEQGDIVEPGSQADGLIQDISENDAKIETGQLILNAPSIFAEHLVSKHWILAETNSNTPFMISDNPLVRQNMIEQPHRGNLGLTSPGIEIYLPLSPRRALVMWCSTLTSSILEPGRKLQGIAIDRSNAIMESLRTGCPLHYSKANVDNLNSLQVMHSGRYLFSTTDDFSLAREMLATNPKV